MGFDWSWLDELLRSKLLAATGLAVLGWLGFSVIGYAVVKLVDGLRMVLRYRSRESYASKVVWVLGASNGIGEATAKLFAARGARVAITARREEKLQAVAAACAEDGRSADHVLILPGDCAQDAEVQRMLRTLESTFGLPDVVVLATGAGAWRYLHTQSAEEVLSGMQAPFFASALICRALLPLFFAESNRRFQVLLLQSPVAYFNWPGCTMYSSNRAALRGLAAALRQDVQGSNVSVVPVCVGESDTGYWEANPGSRQYVPWISKTIPNYSSDDVARIVFRTAALRKTAPVFENVQVAFLMWLNRFMPGVVAWTNRWFRKPMPLE